jgi:hypothetical protein
MSTGTTLFLAVLIVAIMSGVVSAFSKRPDTTWNYYRFDSQGFISGPSTDGTPYLAVRDGVVPVVLKRPTKIEATALPTEKGAIAGICYVQSSGGKLAGKPGYLPSSGVSVDFLAGNNVVSSTQTDKSGYFVAVLPEGVYRISCGIFMTESKVEMGKTTFSAVRAGKRMVD